MNWINAKAFAAIIAAAVVAGTGTYFAQQREVIRLNSAHQDLLAQQEKLRADQSEASAAAQAKENEIQRLRKDASDIVRLRGEVASLRRQVNEAKRIAAIQPVPPANAGQPANNSVGAYVAKDQLTFAGYATPEAAFQSMIWALMNGTYEQVLEGLSPDERAHVSRGAFETSRKLMIHFNGMQILAKKVLAEDRAELKVKIDFAESARKAGVATPPMMIQPLLKVGEQWVMREDSLREHSGTWEQDGPIQTFDP